MQTIVPMTEENQTVRDYLMSVLSADPRWGNAPIEEIVGVLLGMSSQEIDQMTIAAGRCNRGDVGDWLREHIRGAIDCDIEGMAEDLREKRR